MQDRAKCETAGVSCFIFLSSVASKELAIQGQEEGKQIHFKEEDGNTKLTTTLGKRFQSKVRLSLAPSSYWPESFG